MSVSRIRRRCLSALGLWPALGAAATSAAGPLIRHSLVQLPDGVPNYELAVLRLRQAVAPLGGDPVEGLAPG